MSWLVTEAFPDYGDVAQREEKYRCFLAGLDPPLKAKCLEQGAIDLEEALQVAERCENVRVALQRDYASSAATYNDGAPSVQSMSVSEGLQRAVEKLTEDMYAMRVEMKNVHEENRRLRAWNNDLMGRRPRSPSGGRCIYTCGEWDCQLRRSREDRRGRSTDPGRFPRSGGFPTTVLTRLALPPPLGHKVGAPVRGGVPVVMRNPGGVVCTSCHNSRMLIMICRETAGSRC